LVAIVATKHPANVLDSKNCIGQKQNKSWALATSTARIQQSNIWMGSAIKHNVHRTSTKDISSLHKLNQNSIVAGRAIRKNVFGLRRTIARKGL
jgi:hypothetical protein